MWKEATLARLNALPHDVVSENKFFGAYNALLLQECFPEEIFAVIPPQPLVANELEDIGKIDSFSPFVVEVKGSPVFVVHFKPPTFMKTASTRAEADHRIRENLVWQLEGSKHPLPLFHGVSLVGTRMAFYVIETLDPHTKEIRPLPLLSSYARFVDTAPESIWEWDITTKEGYDKLMEIVSDVKRMVQAMYQLPSL